MASLITFIGFRSALESARVEKMKRDWAKLEGQRGFSSRTSSCNCSPRGVCWGDEKRASRSENQPNVSYGESGNRASGLWVMIRAPSERFQVEQIWNTLSKRRIPRTDSYLCSCKRSEAAVKVSPWICGHRRALYPHIVQ